MKEKLMANEHVIEFTSDNWKTEVESSDTPVVVDFWAPWCGPCRTLGPTIDRLAAQFAGKVKIGKLNVDDAPDIASTFGVNNIPRVLIFKGSNIPKKTFVGVRGEAELAKAITDVLEGA
jgi:thioredoxin 1